MPHTSSAEKRLRQTERRKMRNRSRMKTIKKDLRSFDEVAKSGSHDDLQKAYNLAVAHLDKAASKRTLHPNNAARKKSQLAKRLHAKKTSKG